MGGYTGKILRINLTDRKTSNEPLNMEFARNYLSGRGLAGKMYADEVSSDVDALSPENKMFIATGVLTGTKVPTSDRFMIVTKSPLNGEITSSNFGGYWGTQLKFASYDMVILEGKAEQPVYIKIQDDLVEIKDATHVWGKDIYTATDILKQEFGDDLVKALTIGPAGENRSLMAVVMNDLYRAAGCGGVGAVMGSKNVKTIMVRGTGKVETANSSEIERVLSMALRKIRGNNVGTQNKTTKRLTQREACYRCPIACGRFSKGDDGVGAGPKYKCTGDFEEADDLCNKLGLDKISVNVTIAVGIELAQRGYIKPKELDGTPLEFGNAKGTLEWIRKIAYSEGLGAKMALGPYHFAESFGAPELSLVVKTQRQDRQSAIRKDLTAVIDAVGLCLFTSFALGLSDYTAIVNAVIGCKYTNEEILACGERILNNERLLNLRVGYPVVADTLPKRFLKNPIPDSPSKGQAHRLAEKFC
ncbi:MAG: aldehyde ferredoxin oxidoreductase N-terminal domain-containing protein [Desulfosporosinus sp.]|nr:aldehyde ferredoxin oxidoreductase N-terminal domain-containing protein [Desulfosporosinus sp.]